MKDIEYLELGIIEFEKYLEDDPNNEWLKRCIKGMKSCKQRLESIDNSNPSEAMKSLEWLDNALNFFSSSTPVDEAVKKAREIEKRFGTIKQALLNKSEKEKTFEEIQSIIDTWHTSHIMDNETALREIDKIICEVLKK